MIKIDQMIWGFQGELVLFFAPDHFITMIGIIQVPHLEKSGTLREDGVWTIIWMILWNTSIWFRMNIHTTIHSNIIQIYSIYEYSPNDCIKIMYIIQFMNIYDYKRSFMIAISIWRSSRDFRLPAWLRFGPAGRCWAPCARRQGSRWWVSTSSKTWGDFMGNCGGVFGSFHGDFIQGGAP